MSVESWYPLGSHNFEVRIGNRIIGFSKIKGIELIDKTSEPQYREFINGKTLERRTSWLYEDKSGSGKKKKKKVVSLEKAVDPNYPNHSSDTEYLMSLVSQESLQIEKIEINVLDASRAVRMSFDLMNCWIVGCHVSELDAGSSKSLVITYDIRYESIKAYFR